MRCRRVSSKSPGRVPLPPPPGSFNVASFQSNYMDVAQKLPEPTPMEIQSTAAPPAQSSESQVQVSSFSLGILSLLISSNLTYIWCLFQCCPICLTNPRDMAFGCGHQVIFFDFFFVLFYINFRTITKRFPCKILLQTCCDCGPNLDNCPICRRRIDTRIKLY